MIITSIFFELVQFLSSVITIALFVAFSVVSATFLFFFLHVPFPKKDRLIVDFSFFIGYSIIAKNY